MNAEENGQDSSPQPPKWLNYEQIIKEVVEGFDDGTASVEHNVKTPGVLSGRERQIDVLVTGTIAGVEVKVSVECKDHGRVVGIGDIDEFNGKILDLPVDIGIMYSSSGYSEGARARAKGSRHPKIVLRELSAVSQAPWVEALDEQYLEYLAMAPRNCPKCDALVLLGDPSDALIAGDQCARCGAIVGICAACEKVDTINDGGRGGEFPCENCLTGIFTVSRGRGLVRVESRAGDPDWHHGAVTGMP